MYANFLCLQPDKNILDGHKKVLPGLKPLII